MTIVSVPTGDFAKRCPEIFDTLLTSAAFVNWRRIEVGDAAVLALSYWRWSSSQNPALVHAVVA